jgi:hypothetical protein
MEALAPHYTLGSLEYKRAIAIELEVLAAMPDSVKPSVVVVSVSIADMRFSDGDVLKFGGKAEAVMGFVEHVASELAGIDIVLVNGTVLFHLYQPTPSSNQGSSQSTGTVRVFRPKVALLT